MAKGFKKLTEKEYNSIKKLQEAGLSKSIAATATKRSHSLVGYVYESESFNDYREAQRERAKSKEAAKKSEEKPKREFREFSEAESRAGGYEDMLNERENRLPKLKSDIDEILDGYNGSAICIVVMDEDENGLPDGSKVLLGGISRPEVLISLAKSLHETSERAVELMVEGVRGNPEHTLALLGSVLGLIDSNKED